MVIHLSNVMPVHVERKLQCSSIKYMSAHFKDRYFNEGSYALSLPGGPLAAFLWLWRSLAGREGAINQTSSTVVSNSSWRCQKNKDRDRCERLEFVQNWENSHYSHKMINLCVHLSVFWLNAHSLYKHQLRH